MILPSEMEQNMPKIEKGIPMPPVRKDGAFYEIAEQMKLGDSVWVENMSQAQAMGNALRRLEYRTSLRKWKNGYRVWRTS
jgi:hypothetical protein